MQSYRLYYFDNFRLLGGDELCADDEIDAVVEALRRASGRAFELWRDGCKLRSFPAADQPLRVAAASAEPAKARYEARPLPIPS